MRVFRNLAVVLVATFSFAVLSADEPPAPPAQEKFNDRIDSWVEGIVMAVDADAGKFSIRGYKREYATTYANMLKEIEAKTAGMNADAAALKAREIRATYNEKFASIKDKDKDKDNQTISDFTFYLPAKTSKLLVLNETDHYGQKEDPTTPESLKLSADERKAMRELRDVKVGERVVIGFDGGVIYNNAYAVVKVPNGPPVPASFRTEGTGPEGLPPEGATVRPALEPSIASNDTAAASKADLETTRLIRENINGDKSLSAEARAIQILTVNGQVTLKGMVKSEDEKRILFNKAALQVGEAKVTNQLEVIK